MSPSLRFRKMCLEFIHCFVPVMFWITVYNYKKTNKLQNVNKMLPLYNILWLQDYFILQWNL